MVALQEDLLGFELDGRLPVHKSASIMTQINHKLTDFLFSNKSNAP